MPDDFADPNDETQLPEPETEQQPSLPALQSPQGTSFENEHLHTHKKLMEWEKSANIAKDLDSDILGEMAQRIIREYDLDVESRSEWMEKSKKAMDLAMQVAEVKQYPWPKASNIIYPLMTNAAIQFAARAYPAIVSGKEVVRGSVVGPDDGQPLIQNGQPAINPQTNTPVMIVPPGAKRIRAQNIGEHMSWQLLDEQPEWEEETDKLLHILPIAGCVFRKSYFDSANGRNSSIMVPATQLVINYHAKSVETAPRLTEEIRMYPLEIEENIRSGTFLDIDYQRASTDDQGTGRMPQQIADDDDAPQLLLEQHRWWDLDEDGYPEPYIVTVHKSLSKVVRIVARYDSSGVHVNHRSGEVIKIDPIHYYTKYDFLPNPDGGIYGMGFGQLLRPINEAINTTLNMMVDAGHLQVVGGGFIGKGLSMHTGAVRFSPGEYKPVNVAGTTVRENIVPLATPGPNSVLFQLLGMLIEGGKEIASVKDILTGDQPAGSNVPATTTLALIEQGLKTFTAIYKRVHRSLKKELDKLYRLNSIYLSENAGYTKNNEWKNISRQDYVKGSGVEPVSDPTMVSDMQKLGRAQFLLGFANDPYFNGMEIRKRVLNAAMIEKVDELLVQALPPNPEALEKAAKLEVSQERVRAEATKDYAQAILFLSQADKLVGDQHIAWIEQQIEVYKARMEGLENGTGSGNQGGQPGQLPDVANHASNPSNAPVSPGLPGGAPGGSLGSFAGQAGGTSGP